MADTLPLVLVVDDDPNVRILLMRYLRPLYRVVDADSGERALEVLERESPELVLLDVNLGSGMNGYDACGKIKALARDDYLPVLLVTSLSEPAERVTAFESGADDYITKPLVKAELLLRVQRFLDLRHAQRTIREQLRELRKMQALKDELVSLIVHDLRNPLAGLQGFLHLIEQDLPADDAKTRDDVGQALKSCRRIRQILDGFLDVRLLEEAKIPVRRADVALYDLVADAALSLKGDALANQIAIRFDVPEDLIAQIDRALVSRAVENLLSNAVKYSPRGGLVEVRSQMIDGAGREREVMIEVADRGPGVPDPLKTVLFEKYGSVEASRGEARRGYGLGLHLVKLVAAAHGGGVAVLDRPGGGSVFVLRLLAQSVG